jgi:WD40 repeat protein
VATIGYEVPRRWVPGEGDKAGSWEGEKLGLVEAFDFSDRTDLLAALVEEPSTKKRRLLVVDLEGRKVHVTTELSDARISAPSGIAISPDGTTVAVPEGTGKRLDLFDLASGSRIASAATEDAVSYVDWHPGGETLAVVAGKSIEIWSVDPLHRQKRIPGARSREGTEWVFSAEWTPDGRVLAIGTNQPAVYLANLETGRQSSTLRPVPGPAFRTEWSPRGDLLAVAGFGRGGAVAVFRDAASKVLLPPGKSTERHVRTFDPADGGHWNDIAWSPDGRLLALADGTSGTLTVRDAERGTVEARIEPHPGHDVLGVAWRGDRVVTFGGDRTFKVWQMADLKASAKLVGVARRGKTATARFTLTRSSVSSSPRWLSIFDFGTVVILSTARSSEAVALAGLDRDAE